MTSSLPYKGDWEATLFPNTANTVHLPEGGSETKTSRAAPATLPESNASIKSPSSINPPRATFITLTPSLQRLKVFRESKPAMMKMIF